MRLRSVIAAMRYQRGASFLRPGTTSPHQAALSARSPHARRFTADYRTQRRQANRAARKARRR